MAKQIRNVYPTNQILHMWVHAARDTARNPANNLSFVEDRLYSYHTVIAVRIPRPNDSAPVVLIDANTHSKTTTAQTKSLRRAIPDAFPSFAVPSLETSPDDHRRNLAYFVASAEIALDKSARARMRKQYHLDSAHLAVTDATKYAAVFGLEFVPPSLDTAALEASAQRIAAEERAASTARALAWQNVERERRETAARTIQEWMDGSISDMSHRSIPYLPHDYLRIGYDDPATVETSRNLAMDMETVRRFLPRVIALATHCAETKTAAHPGYHIGRYTIYVIDTDGMVTVGCHHFPLAELVRFQATLTPEPATA